MRTIVGSGFVKKDSELVWQEVLQAPLSETGCVYLCKKPTDEPHQIYKLFSIGKEFGLEKPFYFWTALWNTCCITGHKQDGVSVYKYISIQEAIQAKLDDGWLVKEASFSQCFKSPFNE